MAVKASMRAEVYHYLRHDDAYREAAFTALDTLRKGATIYFTDQCGKAVKISFMDIYCQAYTDDVIHLADEITAAFAWQQVINGQIIYRVLSVKEYPYPDKNIKENNAILQDMIKRYKKIGLDINSAEFVGGNYGADGHISFKEPLITNYLFSTIDPAQIDNAGESYIEPKNGVSSFFPLEVGYCMPHQIEMHLYTNRCVARFPYNHDVIIFLEYIGPHPLEEYINTRSKHN